MADLLIVLTTVPVGEPGDLIARALVDERLAACVHVLAPAVSTYRWQGAVTREPEQQLVIKTLRARIGPLEKRLRELHPYEVPEFIVLDVAAVSDAYLAWVRDSVSATRDSEHR
jgi:periplasmic divalent cation tolerance protein